METNDVEIIESRTKRFKRSHKQQTLLRNISAIVIGFAIVFALLFGWFSPVMISDHSMEPTLMSGETVLFDRIYKYFFRLHRSDIIVFADRESGSLIIKRIVGLSGETVSANNGVVMIDGEYGLSEYDYLTPMQYSFEPVTVPEGCLFVLSDDRNYGGDSRNPKIGCINSSEVLGVVRIRLNRFTIFQNGT